MTTNEEHIEQLAYFHHDTRRGIPKETIDAAIRALEAHDRYAVLESKVAELETANERLRETATRVLSACVALEGRDNDAGLALRALRAALAEDGGE